MVLIGGAAGGVGAYAVQLARIAGATVIGTCSEGTFEFLRELGAQPVTHGPGLADRVRALAPGGVTAATDLFGRETIEAALELGVAPGRISIIIRWPDPPNGVRSTGGGEAEPGALRRATEAILTGTLTGADSSDLSDRADPRGCDNASGTARSRQGRNRAVTDRLHKGPWLQTLEACEAARMPVLTIQDVSRRSWLNEQRSLYPSRR